MTSETSQGISNKQPLWLRSLICTFFLIWVNLLSGFLAIRFNYPSLFGAEVSFVEYALPLPFTWALSHLPSMLIFLVLLLSLGTWSDKKIRIFRVICVSVFVLLFLELDDKSPFILFWKVDFINAFLFSLVLVPPSRDKNPVLIRMLKVVGGAIILFLGAILLTLWRHRVPAIERTNYANGIFELQNIIVQSNFRKTLIFVAALKENTTEISESEVCIAGQTLAQELLNDYPFDDAYNKIITLVEDMPVSVDTDQNYDLGEISLNLEHREEGNQFPCYVSFD